MPLTMHVIPKGEKQEPAHTMYAFGETAFPKEEIQMFLTSQRYIAPIWQLCFGDCVISYIRWNQQTNRYLDREWTSTHELQSILTGQPAMISVPQDMWPTYRRDILRIAKRIYDPNQEVRYARMTGHGYLDKVRDVQYTEFDNGVRIIVNFSQKPFQYEGKKVGSRDFLVIKK